MLKTLVGHGIQVAMLVSDSRLPDAYVLYAISDWRAIVPTARRLIVIHWEHFREDHPARRIPMIKGNFDTYLLMPRGVRGGEFHHALTELLSDWGATVATP